MMCSLYCILFEDCLSLLYAEPKLSVWMLVIICSAAVVVILILILIFIFYRRRQVQFLYFFLLDHNEALV